MTDNIVDPWYDFLGGSVPDNGLPGIPTSSNPADVESHLPPDVAAAYDLMYGDGGGYGGYDGGLVAYEQETEAIAAQREAAMKADYGCRTAGAKQFLSQQASAGLIRQPKPSISSRVYDCRGGSRDTPFFEKTSQNNGDEILNAASYAANTYIVSKANSLANGIDIDWASIIRNVPSVIEALGADYEEDPGLYTEIAFCVFVAIML
ncbi:MAG: hypothetical protein ACYC6Z_01155 [Thermoleophilia bacterium]